jgi:hypothetical protein
MIRAAVVGHAGPVDLVQVARMPRPGEVVHAEGQVLWVPSVRMLGC